MEILLPDKSFNPISLAQTVSCFACQDDGFLRIIAENFNLFHTLIKKFISFSEKINSFYFVKNYFVFWNLTPKFGCQTLFSKMFLKSELLGLDYVCININTYVKCLTHKGVWNPDSQKFGFQTSFDIRSLDFRHLQG